MLLEKGGQVVTPQIVISSLENQGPANHNILYHIQLAQI